VTLEQMVSIVNTADVINIEIDFVRRSTT